MIKANFGLNYLQLIQSKFAYNPRDTIYHEVPVLNVFTILFRNNNKLYKLKTVIIPIYLYLSYLFILSTNQFIIFVILIFYLDVGQISHSDNTQIHRFYIPSDNELYHNELFIRSNHEISLMFSRYRKICLNSTPQTKIMVLFEHLFLHPVLIFKNQF